MCSPQSWTLGGKVVHKDTSEMAEISYNTPLSHPLIAVNEGYSTCEWQQLALWNATQHAYPRHTSVPQLVATQAALRPEALALVERTRILSYRELNRRANQLAHYLLSLGIERNALVALCMERSADLVVALLGILKAGAAYVPLDPTYPAERLAFMLADSAAPVVVTQRHLTSRLPTHKAQPVYLDNAALQSFSDPAVVQTGDDLAYVIYTSGSTGRPKGVQITHDSLLNLVFWHQRAFEVTATDRATQLTSPAFDATGWELWPYLAAGASICMPDENTRTVPTVLRDWLLTNNITVSFVPTALAENLISLEWPTTTSLRYLLTGADTLHRYPASTLPFALINNYGPTEATVVTTSGHVPPTPNAQMPPTIGRPIDNMQVYILDEHLRQVPIGTAGELYIAGAGLARGYLNRPELTAERFIRHPFSDDASARLYKTGDRARWLDDGQIVFLGRTDSQIKIRGYRIEPDEVMAVLNEHPAVQTSIVVAQKGATDENRLVAYIVKVPDAELSAGSLRDAALLQLPDYMVPATFVLLKALPLTPNGKIDRAALPAPDEANTLRDGVIVAPETATERQLSEIVAPLLGLAQIGIDENFFLLGGHSLLGTQLIARIANTFGVDLPLRTLFEAPTIRQLSVEIEQLVLVKIAAMNEEEVLRLLGH